MRVSTQIRFALHMLLCAICAFMSVSAAQANDPIAAILLLATCGMIGAVAALHISNE